MRWSGLERSLGQWVANVLGSQSWAPRANTLIGALDMDRSRLGTVTQTIDGPCPICGDPTITVEASLGGKCLRSCAQPVTFDGFDGLGISLLISASGIRNGLQRFLVIEPIE